MDHAHGCIHRPSTLEKENTQVNGVATATAPITTSPPSICDFHSPKQPSASNVVVNACSQPHSTNKSSACNSPSPGTKLSHHPKKKVNCSQQSPLPTTDPPKPQVTSLQSSPVSTTHPPKQQGTSSQQRPLRTTDLQAITTSPTNKVKLPLAKKRLSNPQVKAVATNGGSFRCKFCNVCYNHRSSLFKHVKKHHSNEASEGNIKCQESDCNFTCRFLNKLREHLEINHRMKTDMEHLQFKSCKGEVLVPCTVHRKNSAWKSMMKIKHAKYFFPQIIRVSIVSSY